MRSMKLPNVGLGAHIFVLFLSDQAAAPAAECLVTGPGAKLAPAGKSTAERRSTYLLHGPQVRRSCGRTDTSKVSSHDGRCVSDSTPSTCAARSPRHGIGREMGICDVTRDARDPRRGEPVIAGRARFRIASTPPQYQRTSAALLRQVTGVVRPPLRACGCTQLLPAGAHRGQLTSLRS
jgi:hypothetical protein